MEKLERQGSKSDNQSWVGAGRTSQTSGFYLRPDKGEAGLGRGWGQGGRCWAGEGLSVEWEVQGWGGAECGVGGAGLEGLGGAAGGCSWHLQL